MTEALRIIVEQALAAHASWRRRALLLGAMASVCAILLLALSGWFITGAAIAGLSGVIAAQAFNYLLPSAAIRLLAILRTGGRYGERLLGHKSALFAMASVRTALFRRLIDRPVAPADRSAGDVATRLVDDIAILEDRIVRGPSNRGAVAGLLAAFACMACSGVIATFISVALLSAAFLLARPLACGLLPEASGAVRKQGAALKSALMSQIAASADIAAYDLAETVGQALTRQADLLDEARRRLAFREALIALLAPLAGGFATAAILILSTASLPLTILAALATAGAAEMLATLVRTIVADLSGEDGLKRLGVLAATSPEGDEAGEAGSYPFEGTRIALHIADNDIALNAGDRLAITGPSGIGKTRLLEALAGWRSVGDARIEIDGRLISDGDAPLRQPLFALAPQDAQLLSGTILDNLRLARPGLIEEEMWRSLETACLAEDVRAMPQGLMTWVGDGGAQLSGGQRKRLSIARALLAGRPWLLLDEPSEGLDQATEATLRGNLAGWLADRRTGLIVISHRPAMLGLAMQELRLD